MFHLRRTRKVLLGALLAALLINATVSPVAAVRRGYATEYFSVTTVAPVWLGQAKYGATWDIESTVDAGTVFRLVKNPMLYVFIPLGQQCLDSASETCLSFTLNATAKWEVLSSSGAVLASRTNMPYNFCGWSFVHSGAAHMLGRCSAGTWQVASSASKIRFTWRAGVTVNSGVTYFWPPITRTVNLFTGSP